MSTREDYARFEALVAQALRAPDPVDALRAIADRDDLPPELRESVAAMDADGAGLSALLVARLRFERLLNGSARAGARFDEDPGGFAEAFRAYHRDVRPTEALPGGEARLFDAWLDQRGN